MTSNVGHSYVCSQQPGWQDCFIRLLATKNATNQDIARRKTSVTALVHQQSSSLDNGDDNNNSIVTKNEKEFQLSSTTCKGTIESIPTQSTTYDTTPTSSERFDKDSPPGLPQGMSILNCHYSYTKLIFSV